MKVNSIFSNFDSTTKEHGSDFDKFGNGNKSHIQDKEFPHDIFYRESAEDKSGNEIENFLKHKREEAEAVTERKLFEDELENSKTQIESMTKLMDILIKCLKISTRIISGDNVPIEDHNLLRENYPEIYSAAITLRKSKDNPEEHKRLAPKDENEVERSLESIGKALNEAENIMLELALKRE